MRLLQKLRYLLPSQRRAEERDMQEELQSIREMAGPGELGNMALTAEDARSVFSWMWLERLGQDLRYAVRATAMNKVFTAMVVLSLGLAIGANTAIYSFVESILQRSLPVPDPQSLVIMKWRTKGGFPAFGGDLSFSTGGTHFESGQGTTATIFPYPALQLFQGDTDVLSSAFCYFAGDHFSVTASGSTDAVKGTYVSGDYFRGLGVAPNAGRLILPSDDRTGAEAVAVLSHRFAEQRFGDARAAVGQVIRVNNTSVSVVGIAPPDFFGAEPGAVPDVYIPMHADVLLEPAAARAGLSRRYFDQHSFWIEVMGRLKPGVSPEQAQAKLSPQFDQFIENAATSATQLGDLPKLTIVAGGAGLDTLRRQYSKPVYVLMAMVGFILLITCANIANLLLGRAAARQREIAVRLSIGASRLRIIRQLLTESLLLSAMGGVLGVAVGWWGIRALTLLLAHGRENFTLHAELNWHVLVAALALTALTGVLFGVAPAIQATRSDIVPALKELRSNTTHRHTFRSWNRKGLSRALVVVQIGLTLLLLVGAGLFGRTLSNLHSIKLGFNRENVLLFTISPADAGYEGPARALAYENLRRRLAEIPGVRAVSLSNTALPTGGGTLATVSVPGIAPPAANRANLAGLFGVGPGFFETMQIPLLSGRDFSDHDAIGTPPVAVVNRRFEEVYGIDHAVGHSVVMGDRKYEIVGVVGDALYFTLKEQYRPMLYLPYLQGRQAPFQMTFEVRTAGNPLDQAATVRQIIREFDSRLAVSGMKTQAAHIDEAINKEIALARIFTMFAVLALIIASVGLYGVVAFNVARRTREIGIRVALGATRPGVVWLVLREVLLLATLGLAAGIPVVFAVSRFVESFLFGIKPEDPTSLTAAVVILLAAGLFAGYLPARRASHIDPMNSIRYE